MTDDLFRPPDWSVWAIFKIFLIAALVIVGGAFLFGAFAADDRPGPAVKLNVSSPPDANGVQVTGHGSAVHIGNGIFITAAHVVSRGGDIRVELEAGDLLEANVLWTNKEYDIALVRVAQVVPLQSAEIDCRLARQGAKITIEGNPRSLTFIKVSGIVASGPKKIGSWASILIVDATLMGGMSGGPVYSSSGYLVGITVGVMSTTTPFASVPTGFGAIVPSPVVCMLMGRV